MTRKVVIAHAPGEEALAEKLARPLQEAGYEVAHRGTVLVGESFSEEASKALNAEGPVVLCATIKALGTGWAHRLVNAALGKGGRKRVFAVRMEEGVYLDQITGDTAVAEYWRDPERGIQELLQALRKYYPLEIDGLTQAESFSTAFLDRVAGVSVFNPESLNRFRAELRESKERKLPTDLEPVEFLKRSGLMRNGFLTITGVLLFGHTPVNTIPSAMARLLIYDGKTKGADREPLDFRSTVIDQITGLHQQISSRIRTRERVSPTSPRAEVIYEYPMRTVREIIANALVHRDYEDLNRVVHVRLFTNRIEILSPGAWMGKGLPVDGTPAPLDQLVSESIKRNMTLATLVSWTRLVEGEGSGLVTAIEECKEVSAPIPTVSNVDGFVKVTIFPRVDWTEKGSPGETSAPQSLHQLPSPPADFVGREEEISKLRDLLASNRQAIIALQGLAGVGKTALALKLAEEALPAYPDAQIYLDLRALSQEPLSPQEVMAHIIRSFHPEIRLPESDAELAALYRSILHRRRVLLLLDNAASAEQIEKVIPPSGSALLITSRTRFSFSGLISWAVDLFSPDEARELLLRIAPRIGDQADQIAALCGYLPLALRLAGSSLAERPDLSLHDYIDRFLASRHEENPVETSIRLSYDLLTPELQIRWRSLSVFQSTFSKSAVAATWNLDHRLADSILGELVKNSFVEWEEDRYRLHNLLRLFADSQLTDTERKILQRRHATYFLKVLSMTSELYEQGGEALINALRIFDREWDNIQAGHNWATRNSDSDDEAAKLCSMYPLAGAYCLELRLSPRERIGWLEVALRVSRRLSDTVAEATHLGNLGNAYMNLGEVDRALDFYAEWLFTVRKIGDRKAEAQALGNIGSAYLDQGSSPKAIESFEQSLRISQEIGDRREEGIVIGNLGNAYAALGELQTALRLYEQRLAIAREIGDLRGEGIVLGNLGNMHGSLGDLHRAIDLYEQRLSIALEIGDRRGEGIVYWNLGTAYKALREHRRAIEFYERALGILREFGDRESETAAAWELGTIYEQEGDLSLAMALLQARVDYEREVGSPDVEEHQLFVEKLRSQGSQGGAG